MNNPWHADSWDVGAQRAFVARHGEQRAAARAHAAGSYLGAPPPPPIKLPARAEQRLASAAVIRPSDRAIYELK
jgi:hypothetical protein